MHKRLRTTGLVACAAIGLTAVLSVLQAAVDGRDINRLLAYRRPDPNEDELLELGYSIFDQNSMLNNIGWVVWPAAGLAFLYWFHLAYSNMQVIRGSSPAGSWQATATWVVPIVNFWVPFKMVRELLSFPKPGEPRPVPHRMLVAWWGLFVASQIVGIALSYYEPWSLDEQLWWNYIDIAALLATVIAAVLAIRIVQAVTKHQDSLLSEPAHA